MTCFMGQFLIEFGFHTNIILLVASSRARGPVAGYQLNTNYLARTRTPNATYNCVY
jgi:hypothetical protein